MGCTSSSQPSASKPGTHSRPIVQNGSNSTLLSSPFHEKYHMGVVLGQGAYSVVKLGQRVSDKRKVAVKIVRRTKLKKQDEYALRQEVDLLVALKHPNIVEAIDFFEDEQYFYLVLEYLPGGELFDRLIHKEYYNENDAREAVTKLLNALQYCHAKGIIHRDIKPENILLLSKDSDTNIKLVDFGFAIQHGGPIYLNQAGTPGYVAPELLEGKPYGKAIDLWSVGIIIFMLLGGYHPFFEEGDSQNAMFKKIVSASYSFPEDTWEIISAEAKDLISRCLTLNPEKRITADEALRHPWLAKPSTELVAHNLNGTLVKLRHYRSLPFQKAGEFAANAAIDLVRKVSGANVGKNTSFKDGAIDVARKLSGTNLSEVAIEVARKASGVGIAAQRRPSGANIDVTRRPSGANIDISRKPSGANIDVIRKASGASAAKLAKSTSEARQNVRKGPANLAKENTGNSSPGTYSPTVSNPSTPAGSVSGSEKLGRFEGRITMDDTPEDENQVIKLSHMSGKEQGVRPALQLQSILQDVKKTPPANGKVQ